MRNPGFSSTVRERALEGKTIAILATDGFEESELLEPLKALKEANADVHVIAPEGGKIKAWSKNDWGQSIEVDKTLEKASAQNYDGLVLPGGVINADKLRGNSEAVSFVKEFAESGKPIAAICHAAWTLIETGCVQGHEMTSYPTLKTDLENAGAKWVDEEVVVDNGWVTSRKPDDLPAFNRQMIEEFREGVQHRNYSHNVSSNSVLGGRL